MSRPWIAWVAAFGLCMAAIAGAGNHDSLLRSLLQRPDQGGTTIVPGLFLRSWDPVTIFFAGARGPSEGGPEDSPGRHATISPEHPGAWTWVDENTLQFRPVDPWPALERFTVRADQATTDLLTLLEPPTRTEPSNNAQGLSPVDTITLTFARPLPSEALARMVRIELRALPGIGGSAGRTLTQDDFEVKALDRSSRSDPAKYALVLDQPIGLGTRATVHFGLSLVDTAESVARFSFSTATPFRATELGCPGSALPISPEGTRYTADQPIRCRSNSRQVSVDFTVAPTSVGPIQGRNLVRFDPAVADLSYALSGRRLLVSGGFDQETLYRVSLLPTALEDGNGRALDMHGESTVFLWFPRKNPYLKWRAGQGIAELHGPKRFELEGRGHPRADLRVHRVDPLDRSLWPYPSSPISLDESSRPPGPGEEPEPWTGTTNQSTGKLRSQLTALGAAGTSTLVDLPLTADGSAARFGLDLEPHLAKLSGRNQPGHYLVGVRRLDGGHERQWSRLQVTDLSLTTVELSPEVRFAVRSLHSGTPVSGATVRVEGTVSPRKGKSTWSTLYEGTTDGSGELVWATPGKHKERTVQVQRIVVQHGGDLLVLDPHNPPAGYRRGHWGTSGSWLQWAFENQDPLEKPKRLGHLFAERPVYRPGDTVHLKGYLRERFQGRLTGVEGKGHVVVSGPGGRIWRQPVDLTGSGSFYTTWSEEEPPTGAYSATFSDDKGRNYGRTSFQVEAYTLPTFEVDLHHDDTVPIDRPFDVRLTASYYAGGRVADRPITWRVTQFPYTWRPPGTSDDFAWSSEGRYSRHTRFEATPALYREEATDSSGERLLALDPTVEPTAQPRTYRIEASVTGPDEQTVTTTARVHAVPAFVLGLKVPRYVESASELRPEVIAVGPEGKPLEDLDLTIRLKHRQWHSHLVAGDFSKGEAKYTTRVVDDVVHEAKAVSGSSAQTVALPLARSGVYLVEVEARDAVGRSQVVTVDLYAGGDDPVSWDKPEAGVFELTNDRELYEPGDTARIVVRSPFQQAEALVILEAPDGNRYEHISVRGGQATVRVPIEQGWVPRMPVHVVLMRGRRGGPKSTGELDLGKPSTVASTTWLAVRPVENQVEVKLSHPDKALPGETIPVTVRLTDPSGSPLDGEVTLWLVDRAVLALGTEQRLDPLPDFITDRTSHLRVVDTRNLTLGSLPKREMPGGDGGAEDDALDSVTVRRNFQPVPYFEPNVRVGPGGVATVQVVLPDNLTTFAIRAKAAHGADRFGHAKSAVKVRLPVVVQSALPRFVRPGDQFEATGIGRVVEGDLGPGRVRLTSEGLSVQGKKERSFEWTKAPMRLGFQVSVPTPELDDDGEPERDSVRVQVAVSRDDDGAADAFEAVLPIRPDRMPRQSREIAELEAGAEATFEALAASRSGSVRRSVVVSDHAGLVKMAGGLDFLRRAPTSGATSSRLAHARTWVALRTFRSTLGMYDSQEELDRVVKDMLSWLPESVDQRGLVAPWPGTDGQVWLTANAVSFLVEAREAGYTVDERFLGSLLTTLKRSIRSDYRYFLDYESLNERAAALLALTDAGTFEDAYFSELARMQRDMTYDGASWVLMAADRGGVGAESTAQQLAGNLADAITVQSYQGKEVYGGLTARRTERNPRILPGEATTLAHISRALYRTTPDEPRLALATDALVQLGKEDGWGTVSANAAALRALSERLEHSSKARFQVTQGARSDRLDLGDDRGVAAWSSADTAGLTVELASGASGVVLQTSRWTPSEHGDKEQAQATGFVVERGTLRIRAEGPPDKLEPKAGATMELFLGDVVEEHVRVVTPETRHYVAITVPLAAGLEPLNPALATSGPEATPTGQITREPSYATYYDDAVTLYYDTLPKGTYDLFFRTKATTTGSFVQPAATALMIDNPSVRGHSDGTRVLIAPGAD